MTPARLFISHSWKYDDYDRLVSLLKNRGYFSFKNSSVPQEKSIEGSHLGIWTDITSKIRWSQVVLYIAGIETTTSPSVCKEIALAKLLNKPIIAIVPHQSQRSSTLRFLANETVKWRKESIIKSIRYWK
jgi:hypothetical protein